MIVGTVQPSGDAIVPIRVRGPRRATINLQAVVDTGFNDWLMLPRAAIRSLALRFREQGRYTLANGSETVADLFTAEVLWLGRWRRVLVAELGGDPLLGMGMLRGCYLGMEVIGGGGVEIRRLGDRG